MSLGYHAHTTRRFRKAIMPARHWQKRSDLVRVTQRRHQKIVASKLKTALDHIAALAVRLHGHVTIVKEDWSEDDHPRDEHGMWTDGSELTITHVETGSTAKVVYDSEGKVLITAVQTPTAQRGKGGAHAVMLKVENLLDKHNLTARLNATALYEDDITPEGLSRLYAQHGFKHTNKNKIEMVRLPVVKKAAPAPLPDQGLQVNVTMPTAHEIQAQLKLVYDALAVAAQEVAEKTASQIARDISAAAAEKFLEEWQSYMTGQIQQVTAEIQASVQQVMSAGAYAGLPPSTVARDVRDMIGLTEQQQGYVESYRASLENLEGNALDRVLRSTGADGRVSSAFDSGEPLPDDYIDRLVSRYAENWRNYRADMIARTELITANNEGARAGMESVIDSGTFERGDVRRYWLVAMDEDTCPLCLSIPELNPDGVGMDEDFDSDEGSIFAPTAHPNCRCSIAYRNVPAITS